MKKYLNKFALSMIMVVISCVTMVATTFAWVGLISNSSFEQFNIGLKENETKTESDYGIMLSLTGEDGSFGESISEIELQKQLLVNLGYSANSLNTEGKIRDAFRKINLDQCTAYRSASYPYRFDIDNGRIFTDVRNNLNNPKFFYFDLYISLYCKSENYKLATMFSPTDTYYIKKADGTYAAATGVTDLNFTSGTYYTYSADSNNSLDVYLRRGEDGFITGNEVTYYVANDLSYPSASTQLYFGGSTSATDILNNISGSGDKLKVDSVVGGEVKINSSNPVRVAFQKFPATAIYAKNDAAAKSLTIYKNGSYYPTYANGVYDFGGVLPDDYNFARMYYNSVYDTPLPSVPTEIVNRGDVKFEDKGETGHIVTKNDNVTVEKMIKFRIYIWIEGWDSNCFNAIDRQSFSVNLTFSTLSPEDDHK